MGKNGCNPINNGMFTIYQLVIWISLAHPQYVATKRPEKIYVCVCHLSQENYSTWNLQEWSSAGKRNGKLMWCTINTQDYPGKTLNRQSQIMTL
jgi:hypothetical protein